MNTNPIIFQVNIDSKLWNEIKEGLFFFLLKQFFYLHAQTCTVKMFHTYLLSIKTRTACH